MPGIPSSVTVVFGGNTITPTSVSVLPPQAEVVDVTGYADTIGTRSLVATGDKKGGGTVTVSGNGPDVTSWASAVGVTATLTVSGTNIPTYSVPACLSQVQEDFQAGQLGKFVLTFLTES